jgi:tRNA-binding EMAP/Myf-like protein
MIKKLPDGKSFIFESEKSNIQFFRAPYPKQQHQGRKVAYTVNIKTQKIESVVIYN